MRKEMASIRKLLEHQISGLMWQEVERRVSIHQDGVDGISSAGMG